MPAAPTDARITGDVVPGGTVRVVVALDVAPAEAWSALTDPEAVASWFGELDRPLQVGVPARLDFGDGDFFELVPDVISPPERLRYAWRFLGTGPEDTIEWRVRGGGDRTEVEVRDARPGRARSSARELLEGWRDFTSRLLGYADSGERTRYDWRRDVDGSIELPVAAEAARRRLLRGPALARWIPAAEAPGEPGTVLVPDDDGEPDRPTLAEEGSGGSGGRRFRVAHASWEAPTRLEIRVTSRSDDGSLLVIRHTGWEGISGDDEECRRQRKRFCDLWIRALRRARDVAAPDEAT